MTQNVIDAHNHGQMDGYIVAKPLPTTRPRHPLPTKGIPSLPMRDCSPPHTFTPHCLF